MSITKTIRVMTYNIHHGAEIDGKVDIERIAQVILKEKADLVALQEVDRDVERSHRIDTMATLSALIGSAWQEKIAYAFGSNISYQGGDYGNGILTRSPILQERNQRGLLQVVLEICGQKVVFMSTHVDYRPDGTERRMNVEEIRIAAQQYAPLCQNPISTYYNHFLCSEENIEPFLPIPADEDVIYIQTDVNLKL